MAYCWESTSGAVQGIVGVERFAINTFGGQPLRAHPYLSTSASLNAPLWMAKPWCCSGRAVSQLEAVCNKMMIYLCHFKLLLLKAMFIIKHSRPLYTAEDRYKGYGRLMYLMYIYIYYTYTN